MSKHIYIALLLCLFAGTSYSQDSLANARMVETIEQSLLMFYTEAAGQSGNIDSVEEALTFESSDVPIYSDAVYCDRLDQLNEMSPFHLD